MQHRGTLAATEITIRRGATAVLERVSLAIPPESRIGVVGANGRGKSTLLRALAGLEELDAGKIARTPPVLRVGYLPQERDLSSAETLLEYLARRTGVAAAGEEPHRLEPRARTVAAEIGLRAPLDRPVSTLSGGEAARAALASILLARFDVYLLDEPTNDLDFAGLDRLERFVCGVRGSVVVVSHDREFLDRTVTRIVELEEGTQRVHEYNGGWSEYEAARGRARAEHEHAFGRWERERRQWQDLHRARREQARAGGRKADRRGTQALRSKTRAAARRLERLDRDRVEKPWEPWQLQLSLAPRSRSGDLVAELHGAVIERGRFRLGPLDVQIRWGERVSIAGANGSGKSTLLGALLGRVPLAAGERRTGPGVVFGEIAQARSLFAGGDSLIDSFRRATELPEGDARTLLAKFDLYAEHVVRAGASLSPGERTRAELAGQAARGASCLVLDEPTNHLDLPAIEELERALAAYEGTLILVSHDRRFLDQVGVTRTIEL